VCAQCAQCAQQCAAVQLVVCGSAWQCVAVPAHGAVGVWQQCALRIIYTKSLTIYIFPYGGGGNEPNIPRMIDDDEYKPVWPQGCGRPLQEVRDVFTSISVCSENHIPLRH